jgi:hypothetical protein
MKRVILVVAAVALAVACVVACSGGEGTVGPSAVTSIPESKDLAALSPADAQTLCTDAVSYVKARITPESSKILGCGIGAQVSAAFARAFKQDARAACQKSYDECMAKPATPDEADAGTIDPTGTECDLGRCVGVSVGDYAACLREAVDLLGSYSFSCDTALADAGTQTTLTSSACTKIRESCKLDDR